MAPDIENNFEKACSYVEKAHYKLNRDLLIELYGFYKQATVGPCNIPKPSVFDFIAKAKWKTWSNLGNMSSQAAMQSYINRLTREKPFWKLKVDVTDPPKINGISVSSMCPEEDIPASEKNLFDWVRQGKLDEIKLYSKQTILSMRDENGLSVLHWACDRGHLDITQYLVNLGMDVNIRDPEEQTPLHYAAACGYIDICKFLIESSALVSAKDCNDQTPKEIAENDDVRKLLQLIKN